MWTKKNIYTAKNNRTHEFKSNSPLYKNENHIQEGEEKETTDKRRKKFKRRHNFNRRRNRRYQWNTEQTRTTTTRNPSTPTIFKRRQQRQRQSRSLSDQASIQIRRENMDTSENEFIRTYNLGTRAFSSSESPSPLVSLSSTTNTTSSQLLSTPLVSSRLGSSDLVSLQLVSSPDISSRLGSSPLVSSSSHLVSSSVVSLSPSVVSMSKETIQSQIQAAKWGSGSQSKWGYESQPSWGSGSQSKWGSESQSKWGSESQPSWGSKWGSESQSKWGSESQPSWGSQQTAPVWESMPQSVSAWGVPIPPSRPQNLQAESMLPQQMGSTPSTQQPFQANAFCPTGSNEVVVNNLANCQEEARLAALITSLNEQFFQWIYKSLQENSFADLRPYLLEYSNFYQKIVNKEIQ